MLIQEIKLNELAYPYLLSQINNPPKILYVLGNVEILREKSIAIVGCRECSKYGEKVATELAYNLGKNNIITVSGLAKGIDSYCHIGSIKAKARTIAVVAHGLDMIYPKEHRDLAINILQHGGAIVSEYKVGEKPKKENFPARNRIISGLSKRSYCNRSKRKKWNFNYSRFCFRTRKRRLCGSRKY